MEKKRYSILDGLRGITLLSMICYHAVWDLVYIFNKNWTWYQSDAGYIWQQSICWTFILLSGFCWSLGKRKFKRGITVLVGGTLIMLITILFMPANRVVFGILTMMGSSMLLMIPLEKILKSWHPLLGLGINIVLFIISRNVNEGYLGFECWNLLKLPQELYQNLFTTYLGFPMKGFYSTDYFSIFPWIFLFIIGYFLYRILAEKGLLTYLGYKGIPQIEWIGKHSLTIYLLHQPVLFWGLSFYFM